MLNAKCAILLLLFCGTMLFSCSKAPSIEFSLSQYSVGLLPGDEAEISVTGELDFALESSDESVVTARREGRKAILTAVGEGKAEVLFLTQFNDLVCTVTVKDSLMANIDDKLADATMRISGNGISLVYGEPGVMVTQNGGRIEFIDINTGKRVTMVWDGNSQVGVKINGVKQQVADAILYKETAATLWYLVTLQGETEGFWAVIDKEF